MHPESSTTGHAKRAWWAAAALVVFAGSLTATQSGCMIFSNIAHAVGANMIPAKYEGLEKQRVAIITTTDNSPYSDDVASKVLSYKIEELLENEVRGIEIVRAEKVEQYRDENGWEAVDLASMGKTLEADKVVSIELIGLKLRENKTLFRGQCDARISVVDVATGKSDFRDTIDEFLYPINGGQPGTETTESRFRKLYLSILAKRIARNFYRYDPHEDVGIDSLINR